MSDKPKFQREQAIALASILICELHGCVDRIEIAGSVRRGKAYVGDLEMLYIPRLMPIADDLFDSMAERDLAGDKLEYLVKQNIIEKRINSAGHIAAWGPLNKLARHIESGIPVDFFSTTPENWWVALVVRTGSKETNLRLTTGAQRLNRTLHAYGSGVTDRKTGMSLLATNEREVFELCGVPYLEPKYR